MGGLLPGRVPASDPLSRSQAFSSLKELSDFSLPGFCAEKTYQPGLGFFFLEAFRCVK